MNQIIQQLKNSRRVFIASHANPDGDAVGSLVAMGALLDAMNIQNILYNESPIPAVYRFLPSVERIQQQIDAKIDFDTAVILDCGSIERIGNAHALLSSKPVVIINIDHHTTNAFFGNYQFIDQTACATAELVYRLIKKMSIAFNSVMATSIFTGIVTDTGSFRFSNTNQAAFAICNEMVQLGVAPYQVAKHLYGTYSLGRIKLLNLALDSIEISRNGKLSIMTLTQGMMQETGTHPEDADGLINYARRIEDVKVAALIQEQSNGQKPSTAAKSFHVSLRSDGSVDVATIAARYGGGGHSAAAGFTIQSTMGEIKERIEQLSETI
jgi:phosphoesterase RecJ-like protein